MKFDYMYTQQAEDFIELDDIGNFALSVTNDLYEEYILIITTEMGICQMIQFGPYKVDFDELPDRCSCVYQRFEYSQGKLAGIIDKYINDPHKAVTQVVEITINEARNRIKNIPDYMFR